MKPTIQIKTFGCKVNYYDSLLIKEQLKDLALNQARRITILNTCAVTAQAGRDARKEAEKIKRLNPNSLVVATGCGAQVETKLYESAPAVDLVVGQSDKKKLAGILKNYFPRQKNKTFKSNIFKSSSVFSGLAAPDPDRTRAFLKIQDGCDSFCSFCIIPFARGKSQSVPARRLAEDIKKLEERDVKEAVLTGVHIGDYRDDEGRGLEDLLAYLLKHTGIPRIRLTSLEPIEITDKLLDFCADERVCPHFHISLQSASDQVLRSMKRKYGQKESVWALQKIAKEIPQAFVGMDVIAGFPSESQKDFEESYEWLKDQPWTNIHVFPYSSRKGTYSAFKYQPLLKTETAQRASLLRRLSEARFNSHIKKQKGTRKRALLFKKDNRQGLSRDYWKIKAPPSSRSGEQEVVIEGLDEKEGWLKAGWAK